MYDSIYMIPTVFGGYKVWVLQDEKNSGEKKRVLEIGYTTVWMYLRLLHLRLKTSIYLKMVMLEIIVYYTAEFFFFSKYG